jgi:monoamine oxidase
MCTITALLTTKDIKGFLNGGTHTLSEEERKAKVILQLTKLFGAEPQIVGYHEKVWRDEPLTFSLRAPTHGT